MLRPGGVSGEGDEALEFYAKHTAQIEVTTLNTPLSHSRTSQNSKTNHLESSVFAKKLSQSIQLVELTVCLSVQIVRQDRTMEEIVFPVPNICEFLTSESKLRVYYTTERDEQGSKINDFFLRAEDLFNEMNWQKKLRGRLRM